MPEEEGAQGQEGPEGSGSPEPSAGAGGGNEPSPENIRGESRRVAAENAELKERVTKMEGVVQSIVGAAAQGAGQEGTGTATPAGPTAEPEPPEELQLDLSNIPDPYTDDGKPFAEAILGMMREVATNSAAAALRTQADSQAAESREQADARLKTAFRDSRPWARDDAAWTAFEARIDSIQGTGEGGALTVDDMEFVERGLRGAQTASEAASAAQRATLAAMRSGAETREPRGTPRSEDFSDLTTMEQVELLGQMPPQEQKALFDQLPEERQMEILSVVDPDAQPDPPDLG